MQKDKPERKWLAGFWADSAYIRKLDRLARVESRLTGHYCSKTAIMLQLIRQAPEPGEKAG